MYIEKKFMAIMMVLLLLVSGCSIEEPDNKKVKDLEFAIVEDSQIPEELLYIIEEKKVNEFKLTFAAETSLYIICGYGMQETNGYSIAVKEFYLTSNAIYFDTDLIGPAKGEEVSKVKSYPYIVVKIEHMDENVIFN